MKQSADFTKLLQTGWQSWSWKHPQAWLKFPACNFPPKPLKVEATRMNRLKKIVQKSAARGWCSWYAFEKNISEKIILKQARWFKNHPLPGFQYILIDDGWENFWGDWSKADEKKFPHGLAVMASKIKELGLKPGIWLAPFLVDPNSKIALSHSDWMVQNSHGFVDGFRVAPFHQILPSKKYILNLKNPLVIRHIKTILDWLLRDCGFELIKLDFLYALYFAPELSSIQADRLLQSVLRYIKKNYPEVHVIGCGCPLIPAVGLVDSMRIGPDIFIPSLQKIPVLGKLVNHFLIRKIMNNLQNRLWTRKFWHLDGDAFVCSPHLGFSETLLHKIRNLHLSLKGNLFLGDNMLLLPRYRFNTFVKSLFSET